MISSVVPKVVQGGIEALLREDDLELVREALPGEIKMLEAMVYAYPPVSLTLYSALAQAYTAYGWIFLEYTEPERAAQFYRKGREWGIEGLKKIHSHLGLDRTIKEFEEGVKRLKSEDVEIVLWTTVAWALWLLHQKSDFEVSTLGELPRINLLLNWLNQYQPRYFYAMPLFLKGLFLSRVPALMGGGLDKGEIELKKGLEYSENLFLWGKVWLAEFIYLPMERKEDFIQILHQALNSPEEEPPELRLLNRSARLRAQTLLSQVDHLFLE
ncbi:MAG: TRAP transporter TatT component family protein [bacterium]